DINMVSAQLTTLAEMIGNRIGDLLVSGLLRTVGPGSALHVEPTGFLCGQRTAQAERHRSSQHELISNGHGNILLTYSAHEEGDREVFPAFRVASNQAAFKSKESDGWRLLQS